MIVEYLNELKRNPKQKSMVFARVQLFLNNDGIKSETNYQLVKKQLLPFVREEQDRTEFSELLIWLFMQNAQYEMAFRQAKSLDKRTDVKKFLIWQKFSWIKNTMIWRLKLTNMLFKRVRIISCLLMQILINYTPKQKF